LILCRIGIGKKEDVLNKLVKLAFSLILFSGVVRIGFSRGDKIIPQIVAGPGWSTTFDLSNISSAKAITKMGLAFYHNNGTPWILQTNIGTASNYPLSLNPKQTLRVKAIGDATLSAGYAVLYDEETANTKYSEDYVLGISVFYQVLAGSGITETVSVPLREPTAAAAVPMEVTAPNVYSALAVVNASGKSNTVRVALYSENGNLYGTANFTLAAGAQRTEFLDQNLFPGLQSFRGMAEIAADGPVAILSLMQTRAADGNPQYTLLAPVDRESLRRNTYMILLQSGDDANPFMPIDFDGFAVDFFRTTGQDDPHRDPDVPTESYSWDLEYRYDNPNTNSLFFRPKNFAEITSLGLRNDAQFDAISLPYLKSLTSYSTNEIDVSDPSLYLTFAIHTDLGNYAKARIIRVIDTTGGDLREYKDLVMEVVVYK
jgi:hypothetical protein